MALKLAIGISVIVLLLFAVGYWWRYRSLACPASLSWLVENPYMTAVAGPETIIKRSHLEKGMRLLDVGSGPGRVTLPAARWVGNTGEVVALDVQAGMLEKLRTRAETWSVNNIRLINAGAGAGDLDRDYFDRALLVTVLGEISNQHDALVQIYQALRQGGILSVTEVIPDPHYTSRNRVRALCRDAGFEELESFGTWIASTINFVKPVSAQPARWIGPTPHAVSREIDLPGENRPGCG